MYIYRLVVVAHVRHGHILIYCRGARRSIRRAALNTLRDSFVLSKKNEEEKRQGVLICAIKPSLRSTQTQVSVVPMAPVALVVLSLAIWQHENLAQRHGFLAFPAVLGLV